MAATIHHLYWIPVHSFWHAHRRRRDLKNKVHMIKQYRSSLFLFPSSNHVKRTGCFSLSWLGKRKIVKPPLLMQKSSEAVSNYFPNFMFQFWKRFNHNLSIIVWVKWFDFQMVVTSGWTARNRNEIVSCSFLSPSQLLYATVSPCVAMPVICLTFPKSTLIHCGFLLEAHQPPIRFWSWSSSK